MDYCTVKRLIIAEKSTVATFGLATITNIPKNFLENKYFKIIYLLNKLFNFLRVFILVPVIAEILRRERPFFNKEISLEYCSL